MAKGHNFAERRAEVRRKFDKFLTAKDTTPHEKRDLRSQMEDELYEIEVDESRSIDANLFGQAVKLDIDIPSRSEEDLWQDTGRIPILSVKGRLGLRKAIDEERTRGRDVAAWWWKTVIIPGLASATGLVGALTGLFAVLHRK